MEGRGNPVNQFASKQDSGGNPQAEPSNSGNPITQDIPKKEAQLSGKDSGTGQHAGPLFKSLKSPEYHYGDFKTVTIENVASIPLPTQAPPSKPVMTTTVATPSLPPQKSSTSNSSSDSSSKVEGSKPSSCPPSALATTASATSVKSKSTVSTANVSASVNQPQKSTISGIDTVQEASSRLFPLEGSSSKELASSKGPVATEAEVASKLATTGPGSFSALEGLSSLVSYSSSSAEASASEDNAQDDQEDSSNSSSVEPMDTSESKSQLVGALPEVMETEPYAEEAKNVDSGELPKITETVPCEAHAETIESNQGQDVPDKSADTIKELNSQLAPSKTIKNESTEAKTDTKNYSNKRDAEDIALASDTNLTPTAETEAQQQASDKIPTTLKESIPEVCPPKLQQKPVGVGDSEQVIGASPLAIKKENLQVIKEVEYPSIRVKEEHPTMFTLSEQQEPQVSDVLTSTQEPHVSFHSPNIAHKHEDEFQVEEEFLSEESFTPAMKERSFVSMDIKVKQECLQEVTNKEAVERIPADVCKTTSTHSIPAETKLLPIAEVHMAEEREKEQGEKRAHENDNDLAAARDEQETQEPADKKLRLEMANISSLLEETRKDDKMSDQVEISEKMEIDIKDVELEADLPVIKKMKEQVEKVDEESRDGLEDGAEEELQDKENSDSKDKDEGKEDEVATPTKRRKKKKKSYERPRGEGGKFMKERPDPSVLDEETRMDCSLLQDEDSQGSASKREVRRFRCEVIVPESTEAFTADKVVEYVWPLEGMGEHYFIQEQISQYLGIMSFKRRYPDLRRRPIDMQERDFLKEKGLVSEMACDLGLTAVRSEDVLDVMFNDFPGKFEELQRLLRERKEDEIRERGKVNYSMANIDKSKMQEYGRKAAEDAARWNASFNKEKREERRYSFDLQTFTLQMPIGRGKKLLPEITKIGAYPVSVLPGQYTDYYRQYSAVALKTMPLNSILAAPIVQDQLGSDGACSDSEEEVTTGSTADVTTDPKEEKPGEGVPRCKVCSGTKNRNKGGKPEPLIICGSCRSASHPTCIELTLVMVPKIESYNWQCMDCKTCVTCNDPDDEDKMIFCDMCDRGYHIYCVGLRRVPNGRWHCKECAICSSCGSKTPAGIEHLKNAEWQHEFKKDKDNKQLRYATTLCVPCDKYWKRRQFCYVCLKVYRSIPEDGMVRCSNCPKYIHREVCSTIYENERFCINCFKMRNSTALNHSRIIAAAKKKMASGY